MKCWDNIIGIRGLCENEEYKYYLDDYGIGLKQLTNTADDRFISGKKLFETKLNQAWESVFKDFKFNGFKSNKILNTISVGNFTENELQFIGFKGIKFTLLKCELTSFYLNKIYLYVKQGGTTVIKIKVNGVETELFNGTVGNDEVLELSVRDYISSDFEILVDGKPVVKDSDIPEDFRIGNHFLDFSFSENSIKSFGIFDILNIFVLFSSK